MRSSLRRVAAVTAVAALVVAGCSSGDDEGSGSSDDKVVKIGVLAPLDGGLTDFGRGIEHSVQLAVDQANERDAIPGWTIEVVAEDDSSDPAVGEEGAQRLIDDPAVLGVVGTYNSGVSEAVLPAMADADLVMISPGNTLASLTLGPDLAAPERPYENYFRTVASDALQAPFLAQQAYERLGVRRVAVVSETKAVSAGLADGFDEAFTELVGEVTVRSTVPDEADDFSDFLEEALTTEPELIFFGGEYPVAATLRTQATDAGYTGPIMGGDGIKDPAYMEAAGAVSVGDHASSVGAPAATLEGGEAFLDDYEAAGFDDPPSDFGPYAYDAANVLIAAATSVLDGEDSIPDDARAAMADEVQDTTIEGASGPVAFDEYGDTTNPVFTLFVVAGPEGGGELLWDPIASVVVTPTTPTG